MNQLIIPLPTAPVHSLVSELGFFAFSPKQLEMGC